MDLHTLSLEQRKTMTEEEAEPYVYVTQWFCAGVATYIVFIWSLKFNMLFFYQRVVDGLAVDKFIKPSLVLIANCEPQAEIYMLPALIMNIFTDLCIMAIPAPAILTVRTTIQRKISLVVIFSAGIFVMIAAILRVSMVLVGGDGGTAAIWSCREDFVAICVGQAPICEFPFKISLAHFPAFPLTPGLPVRPIFTRRFWTGEMSYGRSGQSKSTIPNQSGNDAFEMGTARKGMIHGSRNDMSKKGNDVTIFSTHGRDSDGDSTDRIINGGIVVNTWVGVESETTVSREPTATSHNPSYRDASHA
ncbi:hypothetical protein SLS63_003719 [Diaporthe eres]|uniref:Rhodopsin domain-containing protein n=1 Tax=Diaporthe eres TaxID=83184 RepID=A0ABR1PFS7_DIAER